jgi:hypothetical protein
MSESNAWYAYKDSNPGAIFGHRMKACKLTPEEVGNRLGIPTLIVKKWLDGSKPVPVMADAWIRAYKFGLEMEKKFNDSRR